MSGSHDAFRRDEAPGRALGRGAQRAQKQTGETHGKDLRDLHQDHPGAPLEGDHRRRDVDAPRRLVQSMRALWSDDVKKEGTSRVTWEIEPTSFARARTASSTAAGR